jgi:hypothetical protein
LTLEASLEVLADDKIIIKKLKKNAGRGCMYMPPRHHQHLDAAAMMQKAYWEKGCACTSCPVPVRNRFVPLFSTMFEIVLLRATADFLIKI